jgi:hypothetical protein
MNMYVIDIEQIVRDEVRKLVNLQVKKTTTSTKTSSVPPTRASRKNTRVATIRALGLNETYTFRCPKGKNLGNFRNSADETARYVGRRYGAKYRTHRIDGGLQVTRVG